MLSCGAIAGEWGIRIWKKHKYKIIEILKNDKIESPNKSPNKGSPLILHDLQNIHLRWIKAVILNIPDIADISTWYIIFRVRRNDKLKKGVILFCIHISQYLKYHLLYSSIYHADISTYLVHFYANTSTYIVHFVNWIFNLQINLVFIPNIPIYKGKHKIFHLSN